MQHSVPVLCVYLRAQNFLFCLQRADFFVCSVQIFLFAACGFILFVACGLFYLQRTDLFCLQHADFFVCSVRTFLFAACEFFYLQRCSRCADLFSLQCILFCEMCNFLLYGGILPGKMCPFWASVCLYIRSKNCDLSKPVWK